MILKHTLLFSASAILLGACQATYSQNEDGTTASDAMVVESFAVEGGGQWPPAGCKTPTELQQFITANPNYSPSYDLGLYSSDINPLENGNMFYLGYDHGETVQPPNSPVNVAPNQQGVGVILRWNNSDIYKEPGGSRTATQSVAQHYYWDYDINALAASTDGVYAYNALAVNLCTNNGQSGVTCQQPLFGEAAWQADSRTPGFELCPPIILKSDPTSIYVWDKNDNDSIQTYEYSLAMILNVGEQNQVKSGLRIIIDPKVQNGGVGTR